MIKYLAFTKTVELKSIAIAAEALGYSRSKLNHIIEGFEEELGLSLLIRNGDAVELSDSGRKLLPYCQQLVETEATLKYKARSIGSELTDTIRIGTPNSMLVGFVSDLIGRFTKKYNDPNLSIHEDTLPRIGRQLMEGSVDVAFITEEFAADSNFYPLLDDEICLAVSQDDPLAEKEVLMAHDLRDVPLIYSPPGWDDITRIVVDRLPFKPDIRYYSASDFVALAMVRSGLGVYVVSRLQESLLPEGVVMRSFQEHYSRSAGIAVRSMKKLTENQRAFVDSCLEAYRGPSS